MTKVTTFVGIFAASAALSLGLGGCDKSSSQASYDRPRGAPVDAGSNLPLTGTKAVFYTFGPPDSKIEFSAAKVTKKHDGSFGAFEGTIGLVNSDPLMSAVQVIIDMTNVTTDAEKLSKHLKSADFFDVAQFPKTNFSSTTIRPGNSPSTYNVTGKLSLHGVIKPVTFPATIKVSQDAIDVEAELTLNRKDFGIVYPGAPDDLIRDDISIKVTAHARPSQGNPAKAEGAPAADARAAD